MDSLADSFKAILEQITEESAGSFCAGGPVLEALPHLRDGRDGVSLNGLGGQHQLPLSKIKCDKLIAASQVSPFGKGTQTVVDLTVRNSRQVDAAKVQLGTEWSMTMERIVTKAVEQLGVEGQGVVANL